LFLIVSFNLLSIWTETDLTRIINLKLVFILKKLALI